MSLSPVGHDLAGEEARAAYVRLREAMVHADTRALDDLLADDFTLTHMTGYVQPKREWLESIDAGEMQYHSIEDVEVQAGGGRLGTTVLTVRTRTRATIWGARSTWQLRLEIHYVRQGGACIATRSVASVW